MLRLILGKARTGKTAAVIEEIRQAVDRREGGRLLLVPEQYSHEAERELCKACGDSLSLYAEVLSFTGLARYAARRAGGEAVQTLDGGGRLLCMAQALGGLGNRLKLYAAARRSAELQGQLLSALDELKAACVGPEELNAASAAAGGGLGDKLRELALIAGAYDAALAQGRADPASRLDVLAGQIAGGCLEAGTVLYVDGFVDFTAQEHRVLAAALKAGLELTVCLTVDSLDGDNEMYELSRRAARRLLAEAGELGIRTRVETFTGGAEDQLGFFAGRLFGFGPEPFQGESGRIRLYSARSVNEECELAAAKALALVRETGCRWRDIAVAVRGFEDYRGALESAFRQYGVPLFAARKSSLLSKPLPALIASAYEILAGGWDVDEVTGYIRTGLTGLSLQEGDELAAYIFKWNCRAAAWEREEDWRQHPDGLGQDYTEQTEETLTRINALRRRLAGPLLAFRRRGREAGTGAEQAAALAAFLEDLELAPRLEERAAALEERGLETLGAELRQLWELTVSALEQSAALLGDTEMDMAGFGRLFARMLSTYDVGVIPVSLDRVSAGDFDRMRRRSIKHLIVLGCSDDRLPQAESGGGLFTPEERERLLELNIVLGAGESELWREFSLIYNCLSLPSESLTLSYARVNDKGEPLSPSFVFTRAKELFELSQESAEADRLRLSSPGSALLLAAQALYGGGGRAQAAAAWFRRAQPGRLEALETAARRGRGSLSPQAVQALYGKKIRLSPSRIDKLASCRFSYFCQYGLKAEPRRVENFDPAQQGTFMHDILEHVAAQVSAAGGFRAVTDQQLRDMTAERVRLYTEEKLGGLKEKSARFIHLYQRLERNAQQVVADLAAELRRSDFQPLDFELDFAHTPELGPLELGQGESALALSGIADRVDGWLHEGKLYLRVVDYKTGKKSFSLSDVYYGRGLQMLLYLFVLQADGAKRYGYEIVPAGVMYVPARSPIVSGKTELSEEELKAQRLKELRRSGFVLKDPEVIQAWEHSEDGQRVFIPLRKAGRDGSEAEATARQIGVLARRVRETLGAMAGQLRQGRIDPDPYYTDAQHNACAACDYASVCRFSDGEGGESFRCLPRKKPEEVWGPEEGDEDHGEI